MFLQINKNNKPSLVFLNCNERCVIQKVILHRDWCCDRLEMNILEWRWAGVGGRCKWVSLTAGEIHSEIYRMIVRCGKSGMGDTNLLLISCHRFLRLQKCKHVSEIISKTHVIWSWLEVSCWKFLITGKCDSCYSLDAKSSLKDSSRKTLHFMDWN